MARQAEIAVQTGLAEVEGGKLYYEVAGQGKPVVLIHPGIADSRSWDRQFLEFAEHHQVVRYDLRGFGRSDVPSAPYSDVADLERLLQFLGLGNAALVGVSVGAKTALEFALTHPQSVSALVLVGAGLPGFEPPEQAKASFADIDAAFKRGELARVVDLELEIWVVGTGRTAADVDPAILISLREMETSNVRRNPQDYTPQPLEPPASTRLEEIGVPTLVLVGDRDVAHILEVADVLATRIRGARNVLMPGVAHVPHMERADDFNRVVLDFLAETESQPG